MGWTDARATNACADGDGPEFPRTLTDSVIKCDLDNSRDGIGYASR